MYDFFKVFKPQYNRYQDPQGGPKEGPMVFRSPPNKTWDRDGQKTSNMGLNVTQGVTYHGFSRLFLYTSRQNLIVKLVCA